MQLAYERSHTLLAASSNITNSVRLERTVLAILTPPSILEQSGRTRANDQFLVVVLFVP